MENWSIHQLENKAREIHNPQTVSSLRLYAQVLKDKNLPVIFSLVHFAKINNISLSYLISSINRKCENSNYKMYAVAKRSGGRRFIHAPTKKILTIQSFINEYILNNISPHHRSFAYHKNGGIAKCAVQHLGAKWIFKFDLKDFFYSISEYQVYKIFKELGYTPLLSFELARLTTTTRLPKSKQSYLKNIDYFSLDTTKNKKNFIYYNNQIGVLPQGSPSSPALSNLASYNLDECLYKYACEHEMIYTRYADDIAISSCKIPLMKSKSLIINDIISIIRKNNFIENREKINISGPGSKKLILGLLVDGNRVRISKEMYKRINIKLYAINKFGLNKVAKRYGFYSSYGLYNHIEGLLAYVKDVDPKRWHEFYQKFKNIKKEWEHHI